MIWIVGEYAERIDNADELLESFLEGFHDESTQVEFSISPHLAVYSVFSVALQTKIYIEMVVCVDLTGPAHSADRHCQAVP